MENQQIPGNQLQTTVHRNPKKASIPYFAALIFFFMPFILVECNSGGFGQRSKSRELDRIICGVELATGTTNNAKKSAIKQDTSKAIDSYCAFIAFICIITCFPLALLYGKRAALLSYRLGLVATISMILMLLELYARWIEQSPMDNLSILNRYSGSLEFFLGGNGKVPIENVHLQFGYFGALISVAIATYLSKQKYEDYSKVTNL